MIDIEVLKTNLLVIAAVYEGTGEVSGKFAHDTVMDAFDALQYLSRRVATERARGNLLQEQVETLQMGDFDENEQHR